MREIHSEAKVLNDDSRTMVIRTHDPMEVIKALTDRTDVLLEGGPTLAAAFLEAGLVDKLLLFVAPVLAGEGPYAIGDLARPLELLHLRAEPSGEDVLVEAYLHEP